MYPCSPSRFLLLLFPALVSDAGYVYTWGDGQDGRLGHDSALSESEPRVVLGLLEYKIADISAGGEAFSAFAAVFEWDL